MAFLKWVETLGFVFMIACSLTFAVLYFGTTLRGNTTVLLDYDYMGEFWVEVPVFYLGTLFMSYTIVRGLKRLARGFNEVGDDVK